MLLLAFLLILGALLLLWAAARQRRSAGLPGGRIIYTDTNRWDRLEKPLYDPALEITGKPDYLCPSHLPAGCILPAGPAGIRQTPTVRHPAIRQPDFRHRLHSGTGKSPARRANGDAEPGAPQGCREIA